MVQCRDCHRYTLMCEGVEKMATHIEAMTGYRVHKIWKICWKIISPSLIIVSMHLLACLKF